MVEPKADQASKDGKIQATTALNAEVYQRPIWCLIFSGIS
jgi:hypothetical protein